MNETPADRAALLLLETDLFQEAGLGQLAATARMVARDVLDLSEELAAERHARVTLQQRLEKAQAIFGRSAFHAAIAQASTDAQAALVAKREITEPAEIAFEESTPETIAAMKSRWLPPLPPQR